MPKYEYSCNQCGKEFEVSASMTERGKGVRCLHCGGSDVNRIYSVNIPSKGAVTNSGCTSSCKVCKPQDCRK